MSIWEFPLLSLFVPILDPSPLPPSHKYSAGPGVFTNLWKIPLSKARCKTISYIFRLWAWPWRAESLQPQNYFSMFQNLFLKTQFLTRSVLKQKIWAISVSISSALPWVFFLKHHADSLVNEQTWLGGHGTEPQTSRAVNWGRVTHASCCLSLISATSWGTASCFRREMRSGQRGSHTTRFVSQCTLHLPASLLTPFL